MQRADCLIWILVCVCVCMRVSIKRSGILSEIGPGREVLKGGWTDSSFVVGMFSSVPFLAVLRILIVTSFLNHQKWRFQWSLLFRCKWRFLVFPRPGWHLMQNISSGLWSVYIGTVGKLGEISKRIRYVLITPVLHARHLVPFITLRTKTCSSWDVYTYFKENKVCRSFGPFRELKTWWCVRKNNLQAWIAKREEKILSRRYTTNTHRGLSKWAKTRCPIAGANPGFWSGGPSGVLTGPRICSK